MYRSPFARSNEKRQGLRSPSPTTLPLAHPLRAVARIPRRSAVAHTDVQETVPVELKLAAVVIRIRLLHEEQLTGSRLDCAAVPGAKLDDARVPVLVRV